MFVSAAKPMRIKEDILACSAAELNYGLAQFVKEITRPNGERYEPDSIYYLCLGIQQVREALLPSSPLQPDLGVGSLEKSFYPSFCLLGREAVWTLLQCLSPGQYPTWFGLCCQVQRVGWQLFPSLAPSLHISEGGWGISPNSGPSLALSLLCHAPGFSLQKCLPSSSGGARRGALHVCPGHWGGFAFQVLLCFS